MITHKITALVKRAFSKPEPQHKTLPKLQKVDEAEVDKILHQLVVDVQDQISNITHGGCGVFAYDVASELDQLGVPYRIVALTWDSYKKASLESALSKIKEGKIDHYVKIEAVPEHFMIKVDGKWLDGRYYGEDLPDEDFVETRDYSLEELKLVVDNGKWNDEYDTNQNNMLEKIVDTDIEKLTRVNKKKHTTNSKQ